jgi:hypothetical protein
MKIAHYGLIMLMAAPLACATAGRASAQASQAQDSLAAAARRAREQQKEQGKPAKVWDNDNIPSSGGVDVVGKPAPGASAPASPSAPAETAANDKKTAQPAEKKSGMEAQLKSAKDNLKNLQTSLDFAQRKLALDQQSYYQNPNYASDAAGAQSLKDEQSQIDAKKQQVDAAQKKVDDLQAQLQSAGGAKDSSDGGSSSQK